MEDYQKSRFCTHCGKWLIQSSKVKGVRKTAISTKVAISENVSFSGQNGVGHLTVRMAWHDNRWNGRICREPANNDYCNGTHSLLSARIARNKDAEAEEKNRNEKIDSLKDYLPPCFWSSNAFSNQECKIIHVHPFQRLEVDPVQERLLPHSVFTWPFRLSFNHDKEIKRMEGAYPPVKVLEKRIENFFGRLTPKQTILFFYLNYDNPISADEHKYVLLGCSVLTGVGDRTHYDFDQEELIKIRSTSKRYKNFPTINWAVQLQHDMSNWGVLLPYHEYIERKEQYPEEEEKLNEMRVLIDEETLLPSFKYVATQIDEDKCLYLLYKIKKSLRIVEEHGFVDVAREKKIIEKLIEESWKRRGLYPSLGSIIDIISDVQTEEESIGSKIVSKITEVEGSVPRLLEVVFALMSQTGEIPDYLSCFSSEIDQLQLNYPYYENKIELLKKMSLFNLTKHQIYRIIHNKGNPFKKHVDMADIIRNPYLLAENYKPGKVELDKEEIMDEDIDVSKIDIGMIPDTKYVKKRDPALQNLVQISPERLRAIAIGYLKAVGENGDCYITVDDLYDSIVSYPIFYKEELSIDKLDLVDPSTRYYKHFIERLTIKNNQDQNFIYLNEVYHSEQLIKNTVLLLLNRPEIETETEWVEPFVTDELGKLREKRIPNFNEKQFREERTNLLENVFKKSFFIISGKPGTGKTFVLEKIITELRKLGEELILLAPTGKATLRLKELTGFENAQTIDMYLYRKGLSDYLDDFENIIIRTLRKERIDNLIIDETSMVDLQELAILFSLLDTNGIKRIILVGDEKQLPPIGFGKPFIDIIGFINSHEEYSNHYIRLKTNCRQEYDENILELAEIFADKHRYSLKLSNRPLHIFSPARNSLEIHETTLHIVGYFVSP